MIIKEKNNVKTIMALKHIIFASLRADKLLIAFDGSPGFAQTFECQSEEAAEGYFNTLARMDEMGIL